MNDIERELSMFDSENYIEGAKKGYNIPKGILCDYIDEDFFDEYSVGDEDIWN